MTLRLHGLESIVIVSPNPLLPARKVVRLHAPQRVCCSRLAEVSIRDSNGVSIALQKH